jgi:putative peptidoglycan lipid II flippase
LTDVARSEDLPRAPSRGSGALFVGIGIFLSRVFGLIRQRVVAHYFGLGMEADAWGAAIRIPNILQNLFGDAALSASFIPVYASLVAHGDRREADRMAGAVAALLALIVTLVVLLGVLTTPLLIGVIAPGFTGEKRELTARLVRILFPGVGLLVLSAWCIGVLNTHRRFLLSYTAPIAWNASIIVALIVFGNGTELPRLAELLSWAAVVGSALQLLIQIPSIVRVAPHLRFAIDAKSEAVRTVGRNFMPVFVSRGVVQISAYVDQVLGSLLGTGAVAALVNAQMISTLPVSLFGMAVSAAELPAMSAIAGHDPDRDAVLRRRLDTGLRQIAFFIVPSAMALLALGDVIAAAIFQTGRFTRADAVYVWGILAGSAVGLLASTLGRLYSSAYFALGDPRTPLNYAIIRVALTTVLGYLFALPLPRMLGAPPSWGAAGLTVSAGISGWLEMLLLRRSMNGRIGPTGLDVTFVVKLWTAAGVAAAAAWLAKIAVPSLSAIPLALVVLGLVTTITHTGAVLLLAGGLYWKYRDAAPATTAWWRRSARQSPPPA